MAVRALVALGSNLGDRLDTLARGLRALDATPGIAVLAVSDAFETEPWGIADQPAFANAVAVLDVAIPATELLRTCKRIEADLGRASGVRNGPRPIDLDVLTYGDERIDEPDLTVPHPRLLERDFVVTPLLDVAPDTVLPGGARPDPAAAVEGRVTARLGRIPGF